MLKPLKGMGNQSYMSLEKDEEVKVRYLDSAFIFSLIE